MNADPLSFRKRGFTILCALALASLTDLILLAGRLVVAGKPYYSFLAWNLILAWVPLVFACVACVRLGRGQGRRWLVLLCLCGWFFFFPNASYIVTDLLHLKTRPPIPRWYDLILISAFAWTGLILGCCSLFLMHTRVRERFGATLGWAFVVLMMGLAAFGIYLGRFLRWNSWDVISHPFGLAMEVVRVSDPVSNPEMAAFSLTFFVFSIPLYLTLYTLAHFHAPISTEPRCSNSGVCEIN